MSSLRKNFAVGSEGKNDIMFVGQPIKWKTHDKYGPYICVDQKLAVDAVEEVKIDKSLKDNIQCNPQIHTAYRSVLGQLNWLQSRTQVHICYKFSRKRDSSMANLASPRFMRMDAWSTPMSTTRHRPSPAASSSSGPGLPGSYAAPKAAATSGYGYTSEADHVPMPMSGDSWNSFPRYPLPSDLQPNQRVVHTQVFKQIDVGTGSNIQKQLWVTEIDSEGTERLRRPEFFFHGIVGHVKDRQVGISHQWMA